tara:strand:- start:1123 stop:1320 length:198 start_codon:yes stop_codon:yes gene_type:complete
MIKIGDRVYYYQTMNKIGTVIDIITERNNQLTVGGTSESRVYVKIEYSEGEIITYRRGDIQKSFD